MNKSKVRELKWNIKKLRGSVLHFSQITKSVVDKKHLNRNW